jgi:non-specific serine/threonine protein kinase
MFQFKGVDEPIEVCEVGIKGWSPFIVTHRTDKARRVGDDSGPRILVLPFTNLSREEDAEYVSDGLADEIITTLSEVEPLRVISRQSAMQLRHRKANPSALGAELGVDFVLDGSVQKSKNRLRITAQLARTDSDEILWGNTWAGTMDDIFGVQETIAHNVADALRIRLNTRQIARLADRPIPNVRAYEYYLRARQEIYKFTAASLQQALDYLRQGEAIIGGSPQITSAIGYVHWQFCNAGIDPAPAHLVEARRCAAKLFELDPDSPDAHRLCGLVTMHERGDIQRAVRHLRIALNANPNDTDTLLWLPLLYGFAGRSSSAYPLAERLLRIDPLATLPHVVPGFLTMLDGDLQRAQPLLLKSHELNAGNPITMLAYAQILLMAGSRGEACDVFRALEEVVHGSFFALLGRFYIHAIRGERAQAIKSVTPSLEEGARSDLQYSWSMAQGFALLEEKGRAVDWLENAVNCGFWNYPLFSDRDPLLVSIRDDVRFRLLMETVREKWINFEV